MTNKAKVISLNEVFRSDLTNPEFQKANRRLKPLYDALVQIIKRRTELDLTQAQLAEKAGTYQSRISKIESGEYDFRVSTLAQIAEALHAELRISLVPLASANLVSQISFEVNVSPPVPGFFPVYPVNDSVNLPAVTHFAEVSRYGRISSQHANKSRTAMDFQGVETV